MSFGQSSMKSGNKYSLRQNARITWEHVDSDQLGTSTNVVLPSTSSEFDPLADHSEQAYNALAGKDRNAATDPVEVEEFKEEEYELEDYVVIEPSHSADAIPHSKRLRCNDGTVGIPLRIVDQHGTAQTKQITVRAVPVSNTPVTLGSSSEQTINQARTSISQQPNNVTPRTPVGSIKNATVKSSQVRVVPTERLRMPPATSTVTPSNIVNRAGVQAKSASVPVTQPITWNTPLTHGTSSATVQPGVQQASLLNLGSRKLQVKIVPFNMLKDSQRIQVKEPIKEVASAVKGIKLASDPRETVAAKPQGNVLANVASTKQNVSINQAHAGASGGIVKQRVNSPSQHNLVPLVPNPTSNVFKLANSSVTITRIDPNIEEADEKCTIDLAVLGNSTSMLQDDPLSTTSNPPTLQPIGASHTFNRIIPIRQTVPALANGDPLATNTEPATVVKLMNTSLTVTRLGPSVEMNDVPRQQPPVPLDPLATSALPDIAARPNNTSLTVTRIPPKPSQSSAPSTFDMGPTPSKYGPVKLVKPTLTVTRKTQNTPTKATVVSKPTVALKQKPIPNVKLIERTQATRSKNCDCRSEIAKRLRLLDERTKQMESYMNDLIDLIHPELDFDVKPVRNRDELERLNYDLGSSPQYLQKVKEWLDKSIQGRDTNCRMVDTMNLLFEPEFLAQCSWKTPPRVTLYSYTYVIELFKFTGSTTLVKVTIICVGNFFIRQLKNIHNKANLKKKNEAAAIQKGLSEEAANNRVCATNETSSSSEEDEPIQENAAGQSNATVQKVATVPEDPAQTQTTEQEDVTGREDTTNNVQTIIEEEIHNGAVEEYLDQEDLDEIDFLTASELMSTCNTKLL